MATDNILSSPDDLLALINESIMDPVDTVPSDTPCVDTVPSDEDAFKYLEGFDIISNLNDTLRTCMDQVVSAPHDQARIQALIGYIKIQQEQNEELYNLVVGMNNFFGK